MIFALLLTAVVARLVPQVTGHASIFHPSMYGFNVTQQTFPYDNRPVSPLTNYTFDQWWFHGHLDHPPNDGDIFDLPAGQPATTEIGCNKGATSFFASSEGGDIRSGDDVCPGSPPSEYHTNGFSDLKGCALAIAYNSDARSVQPEDFTVFSVNQTCVWTRFTDFQVPERMPACPPGGCTCAWFWIHSQDSGGEQNYMNGFKCNITGATSDVPLAKPQVPRRCGADPANGVMQDTPGNCTYGAKQPFYWFQAERNNMFEGTYSPPFYLDLYNFRDGAQNDIFTDSYPGGIPSPSANQTLVPTPVNVPASTAGGSSVASHPSPTSALVTSSSILSAPTVASSSAIGTASPAASGTTTGSSTAVTVTSTATILQTIFVTTSVHAGSSATTLSHLSTSSRPSSAASSLTPIVLSASTSRASLSTPSIISTTTSTLSPAVTSALSTSGSIVDLAINHADVLDVAMNRIANSSLAVPTTSTSPDHGASRNNTCHSQTALNAGRQRRRSLQRWSQHTSFKSRKLRNRASLWYPF